jgi:hypothetical protein
MQTVIARLDRATQYSRVWMKCNAINKHSGILGPRFRGDDEWKFFDFVRIPE